MFMVVEKLRMSLTVALLAFGVFISPEADGCMPFDYETVAQNVALSSRYALGDNILKSHPISISNAMENKPIDGTSDLFCYDFDSSCRWHNLDSLLLDDLNWFRGTGYLDGNRLQVSTGTHIIPDGAYGIVATDRIQAPNSKATLVSDVITCQLGPGELRFMYWISPEVRLTVCLKRTTQPYPNFDFCTTPVRGGSPGPAHISVADLERQPFQIFIQADNFVFRSANLEGGFAIIDNIEYYGDLCSDAAMLPINQDLISSRSVHDENEPIISIDMKAAAPTGYKPVCDVLRCTFDNDQCGMDISNSMWTIGRADSGNTGIDGDASSMPYNPEGSFAYIAGPVAVARLQSASFQSSDDFNFIFAYHKASNSSKFRMFAKMMDQPTERIVFAAPVMKKQAKRWHREMIPLQAGNYDHVAIEIQDLDNGEYIGVDEFLVLDSQKRPVCP